MPNNQDQTSHDLQEEIKETTVTNTVIDSQEDHSDSGDSDAPGSDAPGSDAHGSDAPGSDAPEIADVMFNYIQQQQAMNANVLANFLTSGNKNVCDALVDIKLAIDTNSRCLLKLCELIDVKLNGSTN